jgi:hypothetical protein
VGRALGNADLSRAGWCLFVDLGWLVDHDAVDLDITVWASPGIPPIHLDSIALRLGDEVAPVQMFPDGFVGLLDLPVVDQPIGPDFAKVAGWLLNPTAPTARVDVLLNGHHAGRARLGLDWPAVEAAYPVPHASLSGFEHLVDLSALPTAESLVRLQVVARVIGGRPQVVLERTGARVRPRPHASSEDGWLQHRITSLRSSISRPPADRLNLVAFTHQLDLGGGQLWLSELLLRSGAGRHFPCMVIAGSDGPLRTELEEQGITVHVTARSPVDDIQVYQARIIELSILVAAEGCNAALINTITSWVGADVTTRMGIPTVWAIHESLTPAAYWAQVSPNGQAVPCPASDLGLGVRSGIDETAV